MQQSEKDLRTRLDRSVARMEEIRAQFKERDVYNGEDGAWGRGVVAGVEMALHALVSYTAGEFGADHFKTERNESLAARDSAVTS